MSTPIVDKFIAFLEEAARELDEAKLEKRHAEAMCQLREKQVGLLKEQLEKLQAVEERLRGNR